MNFETLMNSKLVENTGWTLAHSVWQIALVALVLFFVLRVLRESSANARYLAAVFALVLATLLPVVTFVQISEKSSNEKLSIESFKAISGGRINRAYPSAETYPDFPNAETAAVNVEDKSFFAQLENL
ncbi:MAG: hypothetical protein M3Q99_01270 [Acidobacteriota bacterium]|nr:hypothetical protein [Acidobacteriota bacterium]